MRKQFDGMDGQQFADMDGKQFVGKQRSVHGSTAHTCQTVTVTSG